MARASGSPPRRLVDANTEYLIYQTLVGTWPISVERLAAYIEKAVREQKLHTTGPIPNEEYEAGLRAFVDGAARGRAIHQSRARRLRDSARACVADFRPRPDPAQADGAGRSRHLPGHRDLGLEPGRPGQPPTGRLRSYGASCSSGRGRPRPRRPLADLDEWAGQDLADQPRARPARAVEPGAVRRRRACTGASRRGGQAPSTSSRLHAASDAVVVAPRLVSRLGWPKSDWRDTALHLPAGSGATS